MYQLKRADLLVTVCFSPATGRYESDSRTHVPIETGRPAVIVCFSPATGRYESDSRTHVPIK
jgi:hypothetical protein